MRRTLAIVVAHPDDEGYMAYGSVAKYANDLDFRLVVLHATDGEGGQIAEGVPITPEELGQWRRQEDENAWRAVGRVPDRHDWLGHPDGGLEALGVEAVLPAVTQFLRDERPDVVMTLPPHGVTGHPDHIVMCHATTQGFHTVRAEPGPGLHRLLYGCIPQSEFDKAQQWLIRKGLQPWDPDRVYHLRGTPDEDIGIMVNGKERVRTVLAGMKEHRSQRHVLLSPYGTDEEWMLAMKYQTYVIAWPPKEPDHEKFDDIFAGLALPS